MATKTKASFISPMLLLKTERLPEGESWLYELKIDGYRSIAFKTGGTVHAVHAMIKTFQVHTLAFLKHYPSSLTKR
jgi:hypothetical protein